MFECGDGVGWKQFRELSAVRRGQMWLVEMKGKLDNFGKKGHINAC